MPFKIDYVILVIMKTIKTDARALDHKTLTELRKRAVASVQAGESPADVAAVLGVHLRTVFRWLSLYRSGGMNYPAASCEVSNKITRA